MNCLRNSLKRCLKYISAYLQGMGTVTLNNCIEDLSSFEISRAQIWQWNKHSVLLDSTEIVCKELIENVLAHQYESIHRELQSSFFGHKGSSNSRRFFQRIQRYTY